MGDEEAIVTDNWAIKDNKAPQSRISQRRGKISSLIRRQSSVDATSDRGQKAGQGHVCWGKARQNGIPSRQK